jgi:hypothetical protein
MPDANRPASTAHVAAHQSPRRVRRLDAAVTGFALVAAAALTVTSALLFQLPPIPYTTTLQWLVDPLLIAGLAAALPTTILLIVEQPRLYQATGRLWVLGARLLVIGWSGLTVLIVSVVIRDLRFGWLPFIPLQLSAARVGGLSLLLLGLVLVFVALMHQLRSRARSRTR